MKKSILFLATVLLSMTTLFAQEETKKAEPTSSAAQANNPLANMTAVSFQNYYFSKLAESPDEAFLNTTWVRFAKPLSKGKILLRASMPFSTLGVPNANGILNTTGGNRRF